MNLDDSLPANELDKSEMVAIRTFEFEMSPTRRRGHDKQFVEERDDIAAVNDVLFSGGFKKSRKNACFRKEPHAQRSVNPMPTRDQGDREHRDGDFDKK